MTESLRNLSTLSQANSPLPSPEVTVWLEKVLHQMYHITLWKVQMQQISLWLVTWLEKLVNFTQEEPMQPPQNDSVCGHFKYLYELQPPF